jgi:two-component system chemotaxis sensor kinase CheA
MEIFFEISEEELPIFLAEVDEHLQNLDNGLIRLEQEADDELVQSLFRSAHTIKGMAGMIGHQRMTSLTHALETALDGVRKNEIQISAQLTEACLTAVDSLRVLRDEVKDSQTSDVNIEEAVDSLNALTQSSAPSPVSPSAEIQPSIRPVHIQAKIDTQSMASAARAFQLMMALQDFGEIVAMQPTQEQIEASSVVGEFTAVVNTDQPEAEIGAALGKISGVDEILINGVALSAGAPVKSASPSSPEETAFVERRSHSPYGRRSADMTIRMNVQRLDNLVNLVGELITDRNQLKRIHSRLTRMNNNYDKILETLTHLGRITDELQAEVMQIRMLPISSVFGKFPRMAHDMAQKVGKQIDLLIRGEKTEMDRSMLEEINDPLIHLLRNAVDHGIESAERRLAAGKPPRGQITLTARHEQGRIILTVEDDGGGIDAERLRQKAVEKGLITAEEAASLSEEKTFDLMFLSGISTASKVTDLSGRGVGLDIVHNNIQRINGSIQVESERGVGTRFQIILPLTLAIVPALLVKVCDSIFAVPLVMITETFRLEPQAIQHVYQKPVTMLRESVLSLVSLAEIFNLPQSNGTGGSPVGMYVVVVQSGRQRIGLIVDSLVGEEDVVVKPLGGLVGDLPGISSAAILGEGQVALIVDVFGLFKLAGI